MWASLAPIHQIYKDPSILLGFNCRVHHFKINPDCLFEVFYRYLSKKEVFHRFLLLGDVYFCKYWGVCNSSNIQLYIYVYICYLLNKVWLCVLICYFQCFEIELKKKGKEKSNRKWKKAIQKASSGGFVFSVGATPATEKSSVMLLLN